MGMPVKLSDALVNVARKEAAAADRSITAQIEHWAKLGQSVEAALRHEDARANRLRERPERVRRHHPHCPGWHAYARSTREARVRANGRRSPSRALMRPADDVGERVRKTLATADRILVV